jgi:hypothetical protein
MHHMPSPSQHDHFLVSGKPASLQLHLHYHRYNLRQ